MKHLLGAKGERKQGKIESDFSGVSKLKKIF